MPCPAASRHHVPGATRRCIVRRDAAGASGPATASARVSRGARVERVLVGRHRAGITTGPRSPFKLRASVPARSCRTSRATRRAVVALADCGGAVRTSTSPPSGSSPPAPRRRRPGPSVRARCRRRPDPAWPRRTALASHRSRSPQKRAFFGERGRRSRIDVAPDTASPHVSVERVVELRRARERTARSPWGRARRRGVRLPCARLHRSPRGREPETAARVREHERRAVGTGRPRRRHGAERTLLQDVLHRRGQEAHEGTLPRAARGGHRSMRVVHTRWLATAAPTSRTDASPVQTAPPTAAAARIERFRRTALAATCRTRRDRHRPRPT